MELSTLDRKLRPQLMILSAKYKQEARKCLSMYNGTHQTYGDKHMGSQIVAERACVFGEVARELDHLLNSKPQTGRII